MNTKKKALGRGLGALLESGNKNQGSETTIESNYTATPIVAIESISINPYQPRKDMDETALQELSASILEHGLIQPITIRKIGENQYQLISGERRLRASKLAGLTEITAHIRETKDDELLELALIENIQRENLNAIEIADSYHQLIEECKLTQEELAVKVCKNRTTVTNYLRLLKLPVEIQLGIKKNKISMGHARAIISVNDASVQLKIFHEIMEHGLSVRAVEDLVKKQNAPKEKSPVLKVKQFPLPKDFESVRSLLSSHFNTKVDIKLSPKGKGNILIPFQSKQSLEEILTLIKIKS